MRHLEEVKKMQEALEWCWDKIDGETFQDKMIELGLMHFVGDRVDLDMGREIPATDFKWNWEI